MLSKASARLKDQTHNFQLPYCNQGKKSAAYQGTITIEGEYMLNGEPSQSRKKR